MRSPGGKTCQEKGKKAGESNDNLAYVSYNSGVVLAVAGALLFFDKLVFWA